MGGESWEEVFNAQQYLGTSEKVFIRWLNVAPSDARYVYALASITYINQGILLRSIDGGDTWARSDSSIDGKGACLAVDPHNPLKLYLGSWYSGMYRSADGGSTWQAINNGFPTTWAVFRSVAIDPTDPKRVYVSVGGVVYRSTDGGDNWHQLGQALSSENNVLQLAIDPLNPDIVYAAVDEEGIYKLVGMNYHRIYVPAVLHSSS